MVFIHQQTVELTSPSQYCSSIEEELFSVPMSTRQYKMKVLANGSYFFFLFIYNINNFYNKKRRDYATVLFFRGLAHVKRTFKLLNNFNIQVFLVICLQTLTAYQETISKSLK